MTTQEDIKTELARERRELERLLARGVSFEVRTKEQVPAPNILGWLGRKRTQERTLHFTLQEPTLGTLDRISLELIELAIDETELAGERAITQAGWLAHKHARRCARILAIATLGGDRLIPKSKSPYPSYQEDAEALKQREELFLHNIKPSELYQLFLLVYTMCNLGDFINSIRLMSADRTTKPSRIEDNSED